MHFELIPCEENVNITSIRWPGYMEFSCSRDDWYTLITEQQGFLIPNTWKNSIGKIFFEGQMCTAGAYMPWFAQIKEKQGYIAICETPWNAYYYIEHPENGPYTKVGIEWKPEMGKINTKRKMLYIFQEDCDYNTICKIYKQYVSEKGKIRTLSEKMVNLPIIKKLIGCMVLHKGIKTHISESSEFYSDKLDKNERVVPFSERTDEIKYYAEKGIKKLYLHLDGWAEPGYDNKHPDFVPACEVAGGWMEMKRLVETIHSYGYLFGIHDQYRDYYFDAPSFDEDLACLQIDGTIPQHARWAGGNQTKLCGTQIIYFLKRNLEVLKKEAINIDCMYLDAFTCNKGDECLNFRHKMSSKECFDYRNECFDYLTSIGIIPSSEEVVDWSIESLVLSHYAPYSFMLRPHKSSRKGIGVPLFNLVYHECLIIPWMMEKYDDEDYMLYALLNGGIPYLEREGAYENYDGSFTDYIKLEEDENIERCKKVAELHEKVALCEMVSHEFINNNYKQQRTIFSNGVQVTINLETGTYFVN